jgi:putative ABC transport system substrate-binding protein
MRRRQFIAISAGAAASLLPRPLVAQRPAKLPRLGIVLYSTPRGDPSTEALLRGLGELGYADGRNIALEYRFAEGKLERLPELAADIVRTGPDMLFAMGGDVAPHVCNATKTIPIAFVVSNDPVQMGLVTSLAHPGGNATGITLLLDELAAKRLVLLKEAAPQISKVAVLFNPDHIDNELQEVERAAAVLNVRLHRAEMRRSADLESALAGTLQAGIDGLYVVSSRQTLANHPRIIEFAAQNRLPLGGGWGAWAEGGGLLSYGPNVGQMVRQSAGYVDKILKGSRPSDLPVQQPTRFELLINLKSAKALGLAIPESLLLRADKVIE